MALLGVLTPMLLAGESEVRQEFKLPAGPAEQTLALFSLQSRQPVVFATEGLEGVRTKAVKGRYSDFDALVLMLEDTELTAELDAATGSLGIKHKPAARIVELPPFVVEEEFTQPSWSYAKLADIEVLSQCSDLTTQMLVEHHFRLRQMLTALIPVQFQVKLDVPSLYVLYNESNQPGIAREILDSVESADGHLGSWRVRGMRNFRFWDNDSEATFCILDERTFEQAKISLTPDYVRYVMEMHTPSLPPWLIQGIAELYRSTVLETAPMERTPNYAWGRIALSPIVISPLVWISKTETEEIKKHPRRKPEIMPLEVLFSSSLPIVDSVVDPMQWQAQAALFVRWALDEKEDPTIRPAFWQFVHRASMEPVSEKLFRECFGMDYAEAEKRLQGYLPKAVKQIVYLTVDNVDDPPRVDFREATQGEISRLKGRLERLEISYVRNAYPKLVDKYIGQARRTLMRAYLKGDRDPRLQAELGLCETDAGDDAAAQSYLQAAVDGRVSHPRVYYELARILYSAQRTSHPEGNPSPDELTMVMRLLRTAQTQSPAQPEAYELMLEIWLRSGMKLSPVHFTLIDEAVQLFRFRYRLVFAAILLNAQQSRVSAAQTLLAAGLHVFTEPTQQARLRQLQEAIARDFQSAEIK